MSDKELVRVDQVEAVVVTAFDPTPEQRAMIRASFAKGATDEEFAMLLEVAKAKRLNPISGQIHFIKRKEWDQDSNAMIEKWTYVTSINGLRAIAQRTGLYDGQDEPEFEYGQRDAIVKATVRVWRKGVGRPFVGVAYYSEYVQTKKDGSPNRMWQKMPRNMLAKTAEALALRKAFPEETAKLYVEDELSPDGAGEEHGAVRTMEIRSSATPISSSDTAKNGPAIATASQPKSKETAAVLPEPTLEEVTERLAKFSEPGDVKALDEYSQSLGSTVKNEELRGYIARLFRKKRKELREMTSEAPKEPARCSACMMLVPNHEQGCPAVECA